MLYRDRFWSLRVAAHYHNHFARFIAMPRFVILEHDHPYLHWDFMVEEEDSLLTWRVHSLPSILVDLSDEFLLAEKLPDHRKHYLDYEGPVSENRGSVSQWDSGDYILEIRDDNLWLGELAGSRLKGFVVLRQAKGPDDVDENGNPIPEFWKFQFVPREEEVALDDL